MEDKQPPGKSTTYNEVNSVQRALKSFKDCYDITFCSLKSSKYAILSEGTYFMSYLWAQTVGLVCRCITLLVDKLLDL